MDLTTRCPHCGTTFAASLEQLQLRKGYIRCVQCAHIFDGYEAVVPAASAGIDPKPLQPDIKATRIPSPQTPERTADPVVGTATVPAASAAAMPSVVRGRREFRISDTGPGATSPEPFWTVSGAEAPRSEPGAAAPDHVAINLDRVKLGPEPVRFDPDQVRIAADHDLVDDGHVVSGSQEDDAAAHYAEMWRKSAEDASSSWWRTLVRLIWIAVIALGLIVFVAQLVFVFRVQIAENIPALRPALERMCTRLECTVPYARKIDLIVITQSSLQQDPGDGEDENNDVLLQFTLRNVHDGPQEWPTLVLDLKDFAGALIARKHLSKHDYLPADLVDAPFPANSERTVALPLTMQGLKVNGYQLTAFFP